MAEPMRVAVLGTGTVGASWVAYFLSRGLAVSAWDPAEGAEDRIRVGIATAWPALERLGLGPGADPGAWRFHQDPARAVEGAGFIQENAPERLWLKRELYGRIAAALPATAILASSSSGLMPSDLQAGQPFADRLVVGHPFNPPHLIPLVEVVGGRDTAAATVDAAVDFYRRIGKRPIRLGREVPGHLVNRLQAALWREAVDAVARGVASVADVDAAIAHGPGLRWALMGPHLTFALAGGSGGMRHFMEHLAPAVTSWWTDLREPELSDALKTQIIAGIDAEAAGRTPDELAAARDEGLVALLELLARWRGAAERP